MIDYFVVSRSLVQFCIHLNVMPRIESKHMPVEMKMRISKTLMTDYRKNSTFKVKKIVWDHTYAQTYYEMLLSEVTLIFEQATELININIDAALEKFNDGINRAGECMKKTITLGKIKKQSVV